VGWATEGPAADENASTDALDAEAQRVYDLVARDVDPDEVARAAGLDVGRVQEILARLEIDGRVVRGDSGRFARARG
jgi:predicted Rossmann fold nucleotide-binding protein DprA/Smf involved in DNA uptake